METQQQGGWELCISLHCFYKTCHLQKVLLHSILRKMDCCPKIICLLWTDGNSIPTLWHNII